MRGAIVGDILIDTTAIVRILENEREERLSQHDDPDCRDSINERYNRRIAFVKQREIVCYADSAVLTVDIDAV